MFVVFFISSILAFVTMLIQNGKITRKKAVHRLDIFTRRVYNVRKYVIVCPGTSAVPTVGSSDLRARAAVSSKK